MAIKTKFYGRFCLAFLAVAMLLSVSIVSGQTTPSTNPSNPPTATPPSTPQPTPTPTPTPTPAPPVPNPAPEPVGPTPRPPYPAPPPSNITDRDVAEMNQFLDSHPEIAEQLRKDPSLIDNRSFVAAHPALQEYLQNHPQLASAFRSRPDLFMRDESRYNGDVADMSHFLNTHPEIAEQLRKDPKLIDNRAWVTSHPALEEYLQSHPQIAQAFRSDPGAFMRDEDSYDRQAGNRVNVNANDRNRGEFTSFGEFLGGHANVAAELSNNPTLATNKDYLAMHPELDEYLRAHPTVSQQLAQDPQGVMNSSWVQKPGGFQAKPVGPTPRPNPAAPNQ